jgi:hypothetical protein
MIAVDDGIRHVRDQQAQYLLAVGQRRAPEIPPV